MTREEAIQYLTDTGISPEHVMELVEALSSSENPNKWIPVKWHEITDEEREREGYPKDWACHLDCIMPYDGQRILITTNGGFVELDECYSDDGCTFSLDSGYDWIDDVIAWCELPQPYKQEVEELRAYRNKAIEKDRQAIENRLNHAFNQGYEMGRQMAKPSWTPVSEGLPEEKQAVLVWCPQYKNIYCAYLEKEQWWIFGAFVQIVPNEVVAWMPLPESYKASPTGQIVANGELYPGEFDNPLAEEGSDKE